MSDQDPRARHRRRTHRDRAGDQCPRCGRPYDQADGVDVHHRDENHRNGSPDNLRKRCPRCHLSGEHDRDNTRTNGPRRPRSGPSGVRSGPR